MDSAWKLQWKSQKLIKHKKKLFRNTITRLPKLSVKFSNFQNFKNTNNQYILQSRGLITNDAKRVANIVDELGADGVDLTQNKGYGDSMMVNNDESSSQLMFLHHLRESMPANKIISYTFPVDDKYGP